MSSLYYRYDELISQEDIRPSKGQLEGEVEHARNQLEQDGSWSHQSNLGEALARAGEYQEAVSVLLAAEKSDPGHYEIASNLGTAYELAGDNAKALEWIKEGIRRDPSSHFQSEWLHVLILEAKIAQASDPEWFASNSILGLDFGAAALPTPPTRFPVGNKGEPQGYAEVLEGLEYQLHERLMLVPSPDPVVGSLLYDYAQLSFVAKGASWANHIMSAAQVFGVTHPSFQGRKQAMSEWELTHTIQPDNHFLLWLIVLVMAAPTYPWHRSTTRLVKAWTTEGIISFRQARAWCAWSFLESFALSCMPLFLLVSKMMLWLSLFDQIVLATAYLLALAYHYRSLRLTGSSWSSMVVSALWWLIWFAVCFSAELPGFLVFVISSAVCMLFLRIRRIRKTFVVEKKV